MVPEPAPKTLCCQMYRAKNLSLSLICQSPRPVTCVSSNGFGTVRVMLAKSTGTVLAPTVTFCVCTVPAGVGLPVVIEYGPFATSMATAGLPGNAACNCDKPLGVGVIVEEVPEMVPRSRV